MKRWLAIIAALIGLALFVYVLRQTGLGVIAGEVRKVGAGFGLILLLSALRYVSRTGAWLACMTPAERSVGFWQLLRARLAGEAIGDLTFGPLVAEPLRLVALGDRLTTKAGISSLAVENIAYTVTSGLMVLAGAAALLTKLSLQDSLKQAVYVALFVVMMLSLPIIVVIARRWKIGSQTAAWLAARLNLSGKLNQRLAELSELEDYVFDFYAKRPRDFVALLLCETLFHAGGIAEIFTTLTLLGVPMSLATAFMLESLNRALNIAFMFVPALVGVDELGTGFVTAALGLGTTPGVTLAVIRKIRMFFWIGVGLVLLLRGQRQRRERTT
ncbi:MAG: hypothetical protein HOP19_11645 [Acidobacteria bacterium]|nr:hypothetical protein [Acidobacteriota bacterium]